MHRKHSACLQFSAHQPRRQGIRTTAQALPSNRRRPSSSSSSRINRSGNANGDSIPSQPPPLRRRKTRERDDDGIAMGSTDDDDAAPTEPPKIGWLWDRTKSTKSPITRRTLSDQNIKPKKSLGQNFMIDDSVLQSITTAACLTHGSPVIEVGPGTGALTQHLLSSGAYVTAVEKDTNLHERLAEQYKENKNIKLICGDVLKQNLNQLFDEAFEWSSTSSTHSTGDPILKPKVVANLPYYITKDFLNQALSSGDKASSLLLMLQDEVAQRLTQTTPGSHDWRAMNIIIQYYSTPRYLFRIDKTKYVPSPKVDGAVVEFILKSPEERKSVPNERNFISLVKKSFLQRRKVLRNSLQPLVSSEIASMALENIGMSVDSRAQDLNLDDFVKFSWEVVQLNSLVVETEDNL